MAFVFSCFLLRILSLPCTFFFFYGTASFRDVRAINMATLSTYSSRLIQLASPTGPPFNFSLLSPEFPPFRPGRMVSGPSSFGRGTAALVYFFGVESVFLATSSNRIF